MDSWIIAYVVEVVFLVWILWGGGARRLEGTFASGFLISWLTPTWDEDQIKFWAFLVLLISTGWFLWQMFVPEAP